MFEAAGPDLTRVIERAGWGLRSRSLSTCRLSATARSAEAAILPPSECDRVCVCGLLLTSVRPPFAGRPQN